jgi:hypothetical protein
MSPNLRYIGCDLSTVKQRARMIISGKDAVGRCRFPVILLEILNNKSSYVLDLSQYNTRAGHTINMIDIRVKEGHLKENSFLALFIKDNTQKIVAKLLGQPVQVGSFPSQEK